MKKLIIPIIFFFGIIIYFLYPKKAKYLTMDNFIIKGKYYE